jgi:hypothetical protein
MPPLPRNPDEDPTLIRRLQSLRKPYEKDLALRDQFGALAKDLKRQARSVGSLGDSLAQLLPPQLKDRFAIVSFSRGVLTVRAADASSKFELDRWLREEGEQQLIRRAATNLLRVRLVL